MSRSLKDTKESIIKEAYASENLPPAFVPHGRDFAQAGRPSSPNPAKCGTPFAKGGKEGFSLRCPHHCGLINHRSTGVAIEKVFML